MIKYSSRTDDENVRRGAPIRVGTSTRTIGRLFSCLALFLAIAAAPVLPARGAETCPFISAKELAAAMPALKWSLISGQDGRGWMSSTYTVSPQACRIAI
ncbi:hypothetical protein EDE08_111188 [Bradyrhizobium sp. R2.2-H]|jgi:hypothetical protein|uniref:hypothetical protein n=1 Tax=unclassified Bradyrhizobium TaxID=2631580 RepID=UPI0010EC7EBF|nr:MULTISPECIES: hypothetical protein [unclassified Bradyrhizobium]TCU66630.1 hypothetical protein EDE10_111188 [Bradyrhizobium sp. Y-H1]TCU68779.1 hypothetical protein EDE08_111188 [Bradyrhizobium sp. R2.2-H]